MDNFLERLYNDNVSKSTIQLYTYKLKAILKLFNVKEFDDKTFEIINDYEKIINYINNFKNDNKIAFLNAVLSIFKYNRLNPIYDLDLSKDSENEYIELRTKLNSKKFEAYLNNKRNDNFLEYPELLDASKEPNLKISNLNVEDVLKKMMLYISVRYPMRLDLYNIKIARKKSELNDKENFLYITNKTISFYMNRFKNVVQYGKQVINIEDEDEKRVLRAYIKYLKHYNLDSNLLYRFNFKPLKYPDANSFGSALKYLFKKIDLNITMNDIRRSYETYHINSDEYKKLTNADKIKIHKKLLHSKNMAELVYNKV